MQLAGTETLLMNLYRNVDRKQVQFDFAVNVTEESAYDAEIRSMGGRIIHYPRYRGVNHIAYVRWWHRFFDEHPEYHIVHGHIGSSAAIYLHIAKQHRCYAIAHSHNVHEKQTLHNLLEKRTMHDVLYKIWSFPTRYIADFFFGCSRQALLDRYGSRVAARDNSAVLNNSIDVARFAYNGQYRDEIRREYALSPQDFVIGTVGRLTLQKNPTMILQIMSELKTRGCDCKFMWVGQGDLEQSIKAEIRRLGLDDRVLLVGARQDVYKIYSAIDTFIFPSRYEGLGIVCIEAQAAGLPALCSTAIPEEANITDLFHYLPLDNAGAWADEILRQRETPRTDYGAAVVAAGYDILAEAQKLQNFYLQI